MEVVPSASGTGNHLLAPLAPALDDTLTPYETKMIERRYGAAVSWRESCITCDGRKTFKTRLRDDEIVTVDCNCREQWMLHRWMLAAGIDLAYARLSVNHLRTVPAEVIDRVQGYINDLDAFTRLGLGLTLWSDRRGTGKTMLTVLILKAAMAAGKTVYFSRFYNLVELYGQSWKDAEVASWFTDRVEHSDLLGLDDVGKENAQSGASISMVDKLFDMVLRGRVASNRTVLMTSNLNPDGVEVGKGFERYQQDVLELFSEVNDVIEVGGTSYRAEMRARKLSDAAHGVVYPLVIR